jgi:hypothetical protein
MGDFRALGYLHGRQINIFNTHNTMITYLLSSLLVLAAASLVSLLRAYKYAPIGYEDATGFHHSMTTRSDLDANPACWESKHAA